MLTGTVLFVNSYLRRARLFYQRTTLRQPLTHLWLFFTTACSVLAVDQISKALVLVFDRDEEIVLIENLLSFKLARNSGAAFSLGEGNTWLFTTLALIVLSLIIAQLLRRENTMPQSEFFIAGVFCGGVAGNLSDRLFRDPGFFVGHVVDFISVGSWPTFNFADSAIFISAVLYTLFVFRADR